MKDIPYEEQLEQVSTLIKEADFILVGAGAGASTAENGLPIILVSL